MSGTIAPVSQQRFFDDTGKPLAGGMFYTYASGTSTPLPVYEDAALTTPYPNPIVLNAAGIPPAGAMYFATAAYQTYLTDANGVPVGANGGYTDPVASTALASSNIGGVFFVFGGEQEGAVTNTSYPSGTTYDLLHPDTTVLVVDSANLVGTYGMQAQLLVDTGDTVTCALVNLTDGTPDTPIATVSSTSTAGERQISSAITFAPPGAPKTYAIKTKVTAGTGYAWIIALVRLS